MSIKAVLSVTKIVVGKGFNNDDIGLERKEGFMKLSLVTVIVFKTVKSIFDIAATNAVIEDFKLAIREVLLEGGLEVVKIESIDHRIAKEGNGGELTVATNGGGSLGGSRSSDFGSGRRRGGGRSYGI